MRILDDNQQRQLLLQLHKLTQQDKLIWSTTPSPYRFSTTSGRFGFTITSRDEDDYAPFDVSVFDLNVPNPEGTRPIETFGTDEFSQLNGELQEIYTLVKRKLFGLDNVVVDLFGELDKLDGNGGNPGLTR